MRSVELLGGHLSEYLDSLGIRHGDCDCAEENYGLLPYDGGRVRICNACNRVVRK